jgi:hypothetical protein
MYKLTDRVMVATESQKNPNYAVNWAGLFNNYLVTSVADKDEKSHVFQSRRVITLIHIFPSEQEAKNAVAEMQRQGLSFNQIEIIAKNYTALNDALNWDHIATTVGWSVMMKALGISAEASSEFVDAVEDGKYLVLAIVSDREASQAQHILKNIGHWVIAVH